MGQIGWIVIGVVVGLYLQAGIAQAQSVPTDPLTTTQALTATLPVTASSAPTNIVFPKLVANVRLAGPDDRLLDLRLDAAANQLYVTDSTGQLHILDATTYRTLAVLPAAGELLLDSERNRLYVAPASRYYQPEPAISVVDTVALTIVATIADATHLALDRDNNRLFVGQIATSPAAAAEQRVRLIDGESLETVTELPLGGVPAYNPRREEVLIQAGTLFAVDPAGSEPVRDLLPELSEQACIDCVGAQYVAGVALFPAENLLAIDVQPRTTAGGPGLIEPPLWLDATTLQPLSDPATQPLLQSQCGSEPLLQPSDGERRYVVDRFERYYAYTNWRIETPAGELLTWLDGLPPPFINAATDQAYAGDFIYELTPLRPVGRFPTGFCLLSYDAASGQFFGSATGDGQGGTLLVFAEQGAGPAVLENQAVPLLPERPIEQIVVSPNYHNDDTIFLTSGAALFRSATQGQHWQELRTGLWIDPATKLTVALSPNFGQDQTIFVAAAGETHGSGIFRSTDRGNTWQPVWQGLNHLTVDALMVSPNFAADGTIVAAARYQRIRPWEAGRSFFRSTDGGLSWGLMLTATSELATDAQIMLWPSADLTARAAPGSWRLRSGDQLEFRGANDPSWRRFVPELPDDEVVIAAALAPVEADALVAYLITHTGLWRWMTADAPGERWLDDPVAARPFTNTLTALAVSPLLVDGSYQVFIGTALGEVWVVDPTLARWGQAGASAPVVTPSATVTSTAPITPPLAATPAPPTGEPPTGYYRPQGTFAGVWAANETVQTALGWAQSEQSRGVAAAVQTFEQGLMVWREDAQEIVVLFSDGTWERYPDTFREGEPESDPTLSAPAGRWQPVRGFGKVWRSEAAVRERLGWATAREQGITAQVQRFERGTMLWVNGLIYVLIEEPDGTQRWLVA